MFSRNIKKILNQYVKFPSIALLGPRQSGKTTFVKAAFPKHTYVTFEHEPTRIFAQEDPEGFLAAYSSRHGLIIDEFQYVPNITSYLQLVIDETKRPGYFVLTGSQNFLANQSITQSLAGRIGILNLFPLSIHELEKNKLLQQDLNTLLFTGGYPRVYEEKLDPVTYYSSYLQTYIERDVRQIANVGDLKSFRTFTELCAGRIGQILNIDSLAGDAGISFHKARAWLSVLEASYILFLIEPHSKKFSKRVTKSPKVFFFDTGLACSLLRISAPEMLIAHPFRGNIFESLIISDLYKQYCNGARRPSLFFWRDTNGRYEVDCIIDEGQHLFPLEIKSGMTIGSDFFKGLTYWNELSQVDPKNSYIVYGGTKGSPRKQGNIIGWKTAGKLLSSLEIV